MDTDNNLDSRGMILVIDDEDMLRDVLKEVLDMAGFFALFAGSGKEGLELFEKNRDKIKLVILDVLMPEMSGIETYNAIFALEPDMRFIFMSGFPDKDALALRELVGDYMFVRKPFSVNDIVTKIKQALS